MKTHSLKSSIQTSFDVAAHSYNNNAHVQERIAEDNLREFAQLDRADLALLVDLGCGTAKANKVLANCAHAYLGLDLSRKMLLEGKRSSIRANTHHCSNWIQGDLESLPFQDKSVDAFYSSMALQWCTSTLTFIKEVKRCLKPKGSATFALMVDGSFSEVHKAWQNLNMSSRLNTFTSEAQWLETAKMFDWHVTSTVRNYITEHDSLLNLLRSVKSVGANIKSQPQVQQCSASKQKQGFISRAELRDLEFELTRHNAAQAFELSYRVLFLTIQNKDK
ncbi:methyltransferase domain-containing protein [Glaciecola sp. 2405UD65-10]|uniref:methyltransferase domain-containing protein n=1 Tax=Glaciecola sp. 2405UD65-10 TaxID=3397244 RepID=UPI003B5AB679